MQSRCSVRVIIALWAWKQFDYFVCFGRYGWSQNRAIWKLFWTQSSNRSAPLSTFCSLSFLSSRYMESLVWSYFQVSKSQIWHFLTCSWNKLNRKIFLMIIRVLHNFRTFSLGYILTTKSSTMEMCAASSTSWHLCRSTPRKPWLFLLFRGNHHRLCQLYNWHANVPNHKLRFEDSRNSMWCIQRHLLSIMDWIYRWYQFVQ